MVLYELKGVKKYYGCRLGLDISSLTINRGNLYIIYGPNASGKTTLLNLLAFLDIPTEGKIAYNGRLSDRMGITLMMQNPYLFNGTVIHNVASGLFFRSISRRKAEETAVPIMKQLGIWALRKRLTGSLSGGERKKVALARAVVLDTEVLLLDEPTSHIDKTHSSLIEKIIRSSAQDSKKTVIMTTHDLGQAHRLTSNIIYLLNGRSNGTPLWNLFPVHLTGANGVKKGRIDPDTEIYVATSRTGPVKIVINPKDIIVSHRHFHSSALNNLRSRIVGVSEVDGLVDLSVESGVRLHAFITHKSFRDMQLSIGDDVFVAFKASAVEVFD